MLLCKQKRSNGQCWRIAAGTHCCVSHASLFSMWLQAPRLLALELFWHAAMQAQCRHAAEPSQSYKSEAHQTAALRDAYGAVEAAAQDVGVKSPLWQCGLNTRWQQGARRRCPCGPGSACAPQRVLWRLRAPPSWFSSALCGHLPCCARAASSHAHASCCQCRHMVYMALKTDDGDDDDGHDGHDDCGSHVQTSSSPAVFCLRPHLICLHLLPCIGRAGP